ncbi:hypothetical protein HJFPF1_07566 [Paramyrothecium foliicola]|nr:hypothetical protein HJFPF1_07566 [Paramyrothecium foliicola]
MAIRLYFEQSTMRLHHRRGLAGADSLRLVIRQQEEDSEDSGDESSGVESTSSSPASPASPTLIAPSIQSSASLPSPTSPTSLEATIPIAPPPVATATTSLFLPSIPSTTSSDEPPISSESPSEQSSSSAPTLVPSSSERAPTSSDFTSSRSISSAPLLVPTSFETQTSSSQSSTSAISDSVLLPSQGPVRGGAENAENNPGTTEPAQRIGLITGATVGTIGGCILIGLLIIFFCKRRARKQPQEQLHQEVLADETTRSQKSHSTILDQVMAAVYAWGNEPESVRRNINDQNENWYPQEKLPGNTNTAPDSSPQEPSGKSLDSVRVWLSKVTQQKPNFRASQATSVSKAKTGWPSVFTRPDGRYQELDDGVPYSGETARRPPSSFPMPSQEPTSQPRLPPTVARPPSVSGVTDMSSRYTISSNSTWFRWEGKYK